jgi:hypothetical protein
MTGPASAGLRPLYRNVHDAAFVTKGGGLNGWTQHFNL